MKSPHVHTTFSTFYILYPPTFSYSSRKTNAKHTIFKIILASQNILKILADLKNYSYFRNLYYKYLKIKICIVTRKFCKKKMSNAGPLPFYRSYFQFGTNKKVFFVNQKLISS